jgi:hypothetical protein
MNAASFRNHSTRSIACCERTAEIGNLVEKWNDETMVACRDGEMVLGVRAGHPIHARVKVSSSVFMNLSEEG